MIYFDNNATTQPLPEVVEAMLPFLTQQYANPSSVHYFGQQAKHHLEIAREKLAALIGAQPREIVFTGGGTESIHTALRGLLAVRADKRHVLTSTVEHQAVRRTCERLREEGYDVEEIGVDGQGRLDVAELRASLRDDTALVTLLHANNETGVLFDLEALAEACANRGVAFHVDAVQSAGKVPIDVSRSLVTLLSLSAHKFHGPKGVGALYVRRPTRLAPLLVGGNQEHALRAGTENVAGIVGAGVAAEWARLRLSLIDDVRQLRDRLERGVLASFPGAVVHGAGMNRIANTTNIGFPGLSAEAILILLGERGICASSGSACSSGSLEPSHVLAAMGVEPRTARGAIRWSLSHFNTRDEVDQVVTELPSLLARLAVLNTP